MPAAVPSPPQIEAGPRRLRPVSGYTLALTWTPEFCRLRAGRHARQCGGKAGRFGFTVHGLWPNSADGWPQWCRAAAPPPAAAVRRTMCHSPDAALIARQWAKHGTCMTRRPETYLRVTRILYDGLRWPDFVEISREADLTAGTVRARFAAANPGWFPAAVGMRVNRRGWLEELRLCYDRRFMPAVCDRDRRGVADAARVQIYRGR